MTYEVTSRSLTDDHTSLVISVKNKNTQFPLITYKFLSFVKSLAFLMAIVITFMNKETLATTITSSLNYSETSRKSPRDADDVLRDMDSLVLTLMLATIAIICQKVVGSKIISEDLMLVKDLGVQIESHRINGKPTRRFLDISRVRDIVINEVSSIVSHV